MRIDILTIFPEVFTPLDVSILKRAREKGLLEIRIWDLRDFTGDRHRKVDDAPYGGGKGMVLQCDPIFRGIEAIRTENPEGKAVLTTPQGTLFTHNVARMLAVEKGLILVCGHYEGVDERVTSACDMELSIGDYVVTGGELPAMVIVDCVARMVPGVLPDEAAAHDSFFEYLLDWPCYTRPAEYRGMRVPDVLLSGDHEKIRRWRREEAFRRTRERRPDLAGRIPEEPSGERKGREAREQ